MYFKTIQDTREMRPEGIWMQTPKAAMLEVSSHLVQQTGEKLMDQGNQLGKQVHHNTL